jgi:hypothetical protein
MLSEGGGSASLYAKEAVLCALSKCLPEPSWHPHDPRLISWFGQQSAVEAVRRKVNFKCLTASP